MVFVVYHHKERRKKIIMVFQKYYLVVMFIHSNIFSISNRKPNIYFSLQTKTNSISWNPMEPMNFTAVSIIIEFFHFSCFLVPSVYI